MELNGVAVLDWEAEPRGKVKDFAESGYMGLQNHDSRSPVFFRNIFIKEIKNEAQPGLDIPDSGEPALVPREILVQN